MSAVPRFQPVGLPSPTEQQQPGRDVVDAMKAVADSINQSSQVAAQVLNQAMRSAGEAAKTKAAGAAQGAQAAQAGFAQAGQNIAAGKQAERGRQFAGEQAEAGRQAQSRESEKARAFQGRRDAEQREHGLNMMRESERIDQNRVGRIKKDNQIRESAQRNVALNTTKLNYLYGQLDTVMEAGGNPSPITDAISEVEGAIREGELLDNAHTMATVTRMIQGQKAKIAKTAANRLKLERRRRGVETGLQKEIAGSQGMQERLLSMYQQSKTGLAGRVINEFQREWDGAQGAEAKNAVADKAARAIARRMGEEMPSHFSKFMTGALTVSPEQMGRYRQQLGMVGNDPMSPPVYRASMRAAELFLSGEGGEFRTLMSDLQSQGGGTSSPAVFLQAVAGRVNRGFWTLSKSPLYRQQNVKELMLRMEEMEETLGRPPSTNEVLRSSGQILMGMAPQIAAFGGIANLGPRGPAQDFNFGGEEALPTHPAPTKTQASQAEAVGLKRLLPGPPKRGVPAMEPRGARGARNLQKAKQELKRLRAEGPPPPGQGRQWRARIKRLEAQIRAAQAAGGR